jgi:DNA transformation protein
MDKEFLIELFQPFGGVAVRNMFGGQGISHQGLNIAIVIEGALCLKADEETTPMFEGEGMTAWKYQRKDGKPIDMGYWTVPERLFDDPDEFGGWAQSAFEAALRADAKKPASKRKFKELF